MRTEMAAALKVDEQPAAIEAPTGRIPVVTVQLMQPAAVGLLTVDRPNKLPLPSWGGCSLAPKPQRDGPFRPVPR